MEEARHKKWVSSLVFPYAISPLLAGFEKSIIDEHFESMVPRSVTAEMPTSNSPTVEYRPPLHFLFLYSTFHFYLPGLEFSYKAQFFLGVFLV